MYLTRILNIQRLHKIKILSFRLKGIIYVKDIIYISMELAKNHYTEPTYHHVADRGNLYTQEGQRK